MDDATKVETGASGAILRIGKTLARFDAIDTGLFRATPALAEAIGGGGGSLSEGVQRLADRRMAATIDVTGLRWLDVDDAAALAKAEAMLG
jgi:1L-myo-inositol 1-phosphate cytidylyltransferase